MASDEADKAERVTLSFNVPRELRFVVERQAKAPACRRGGRMRGI